jgi:hypothetical protein
VPAGSSTREGTAPAATTGQATRSPEKTSSSTTPSSASNQTSDDEDVKPDIKAPPGPPLPKLTSCKVGDLPEGAQRSWKELVKSCRVWFGEMENPWNIDDAAIDRVLPALWKQFIGTDCDWDSVHPTHRKVARNVVSTSRSKQEVDVTEPVSKLMQKLCEWRKLIADTALVCVKNFLADLDDEDEIIEYCTWALDPNELNYRYRDVYKDKTVVRIPA